MEEETIAGRRFGAISIYCRDEALLKKNKKKIAELEMIDEALLKKNKKKIAELEMIFLEFSRTVHNIMISEYELSEYESLNKLKNTVEVLSLDIERKINLQDDSLTETAEDTSTYSEEIQSSSDKMIQKTEKCYYKGKKMHFTESDPQFILEVLEDDYAKLDIHESSSGFRVCDSTDPSYYDLLFKGKNGLLRIYHSDDLDEVKKIHDLVKEKVPEVVKSEPMISTSMSRLMNVVRVIRKHPTWSSTHILAHLGYSEGFKSEEIKRHINESCGENSVTPLHVAIEARRKSSIEALLELAASLESKDSVGRNPLHYAALIPDEEILETLLKSKQECKSLIDMKDFSGNTGLHLSIENDCIKTAIVFLTHEADANILNKDGNRPLHLAIKRQQLSFVRALLLFGADVNLRNAKGESPRHCAATSTDLVGGLLYILHLMGALRCPDTGNNCNEGCSPNGAFNGTRPKNRTDGASDETNL